jgi:hypothetical protein
MAHQRFHAIDDLIRQTERDAAGKTDLVRLVSDVVELAGDEGADPYLLIGVLVENAIHTLTQHVPPERQVDTALALAALLVDWFEAHGLIER